MGPIKSARGAKQNADVEIPAQGMQSTGRRDELSFCCSRAGLIGPGGSAFTARQYSHCVAVWML